MKHLLFLLLLLTVNRLLIGQTLPVLPGKPKPQPTAQSKTKTKSAAATGLKLAPSSSPKVETIDGILTVTIGSQKWMLKNLDVGHFLNGDVIPEARTEDEWIRYCKEGKPAWCYYDNDQANEPKFGKLYNWFAVVDPRGLSPRGWHIPSDGEWMDLIIRLGGENEAGGKMKSPTYYWELPNTKANNSSGFSGLPGGFRNESGVFNLLGKSGYWWSTSLFNSIHVWYFTLNRNNSDAVREYLFTKLCGFSVRCIRD